MPKSADAHVRITSAPISPAEEQRGRIRRYVVSMSIRTVCFVLAVVFAGSWLMWVFLVGAVFMPYVAVVFANTADHRPAEADLREATHTRNMLTASGD